MSGIRAILFDLGRVLIGLDGPPIKDHWLSETVDEAETWLRWSQSAAVKAFESGQLSVDEFAQEILKEQGFCISPDQFIQEFERWPTTFFEGATALLEQLRQGYTLAYYSNISELHLSRLLKVCDLNDYFDFPFASYKIGFHKPDLQGYEYVVASIGIPAAEILFIDDSLKNVEAARQVGLQAEQAIGFEAVTQVLKNRGCI